MKDVKNARVGIPSQRPSGRRRAFTGIPAGDAMVYWLYPWIMKIMES